MPPAVPLLTTVTGAALLGLGALATSRRADPPARWFGGVVTLVGGSAVLFAASRAGVLPDLTLPLAFGLATLAPVAWLGYARGYAGRGDGLSVGRLALASSYPAVVAALAAWRGTTLYLGRTYGWRGLLDPLEGLLALGLGLPLLVLLGAWVAALVAAGAVVLVREGDAVVGLVSTTAFGAPLLAAGLLRPRLGVPVEVPWTGIGFAVALVGFAVVWFALPWEPSRAPDGR